MKREILEPKASRVSWALREIRVTLVCRAKKETKVTPALRVPQVLMARMVYLSLTNG